MKEKIKYPTTKEVININKQLIDSLNLKFRKNDIIEKDWIVLRLNHKGTQEPSLIFCDKIVYWHGKNKEKNIFDHHIMIYRKGNLIFKVYLPNDIRVKEFKNAKEALEKTGFEIAK